MLKAFLCMISHCIELSVRKNIYSFEKSLCIISEKMFHVITILLEATK